MYCFLVCILGCIYNSHQVPVARLEDAFDQFHAEFREKRVITTVQPKIWGIVIAGSKDFENYRHQADALHAYQIMKRNGVPKEQIVLMMYDDIAYNTANPYKGNIINTPSGPNLYTDLSKDYTGADVTPANFLNVLIGNSKDGKKVIKSTENDYVFIYYSDHGGPGVIGFPNEEGVWSDDITYVINYMRTNKKYSKLLFYIEACYSGSLFEDHLEDDLQVYAVTAANSTQESYATTYDSNRKIFISDEWSTAWMADADYNDIRETTVLEQYQLSVAKTKYSNPMKYGDPKLSTLPLSDFMGPKGVTLQRLGKRSETEDNETAIDEDISEERVSQDEVHTWMCKKRMQESRDPAQRAKYKAELDRVNQNKGTISSIIRTIVSILMTDVLAITDTMTHKFAIKNHKCYVPVAKAFHENCYNIFRHDHARVSLHRLVALCNRGIPVDLIKSTISLVCSTAPALVEPVTDLFDNAIDAVPVVGTVKEVVSTKVQEVLNQPGLPTLGSLTPTLLQSMTPTADTTKTAPAPTKPAPKVSLPLKLPFKLF